MAKSTEPAMDKLTLHTSLVKAAPQLQNTTDASVIENFNLDHGMLDVEEVSLILLILCRTF